MGCDLKTFSQYLQKLLDIDSYEDVFINGLQIEGKEKIAKIVTAVTASKEVIRKACAIKADALLVHHGLIFKGKDLLIQGPAKQKIELLLQHNMSLYTYHIPLDAHKTLGNNWAVARAMKWKQMQPFGPPGRLIGVQGLFSAVSRQAFLHRFEQFYQHEGTVVFGGKKTVSSCAIVSGSGHKLIHDAIRAGVDCFITGTVDEPIWHIAREEKINFYAFGHAATEKIGIRLLGEHLKKKFHLEHTFIDEPNPF
jgi:dinuclear metal center YbgI/SA1388 family protein